MNEEKKQIKTLSLDGVNIPYPDGIQSTIDEKTGFGLMIFQYVGNPDDCYNSFKEIKKNYGNKNFLSITST